jgi:hypothetical protein
MWAASPSNAAPGLAPFKGIHLPVADLALAPGEQQAGQKGRGPQIRKHGASSLVPSY